MPSTSIQNSNPFSYARSLGKRGDITEWEEVFWLFCIGRLIATNDGDKIFKRFWQWRKFHNKDVGSERFPWHWEINNELLISKRVWESVPKVKFTGAAVTAIIILKNSRFVLAHRSHRGFKCSDCQRSIYSRLYENQTAAWWRFHCHCVACLILKMSMEEYSRVSLIWVPKWCSLISFIFRVLRSEEFREQEWLSLNSRTWRLMGIIWSTWLSPLGALLSMVLVSPAENTVIRFWPGIEWR